MEFVATTTVADTSHASTKRKRARQACDHCRAKKIRCNGEAGQSCPNCVDRGHACVTTSIPRRTRNRHASSTSTLPAPDSTSLPLEAVESIVEADDGFGTSTVDLQETSSMPPNDMTNWEYHGPRSFLSICSKPAVKWVSGQTGDSRFAIAASTFAADITRRLKMDDDMSAARVPEPDAETAWRYTEAYFAVALDASHGVLHRPWFEDQLAAHLAGTSTDSSTTWHALRNVVYAAGCRIELSKTHSFKEASQKAWLYFENALQVYARLLFYKTSITGVQVLTLMAYYTQNIGTPCLEYILSSDAARLAVAKGLHRAAPSYQGLTDQDIEQRSRIFWAIYCLEKQIASQASRPSIIDDEEISCPLPSASGSPGSAFCFAYCRSLIRVSQVSSRIETRLSAVRCSRLGAGPTVATVNQLHAELDSVKTFLHDAFGLDLNAKFEPAQLPEPFNLAQAVYIRFAYSTAMLSVHTIWAYPWLRSLVGLRPEDKSRDYVVRSSEAVARISREVIMMTEHIHFQASTTVPVAFFAPVYALISLFVHCLDRKKSASDLALMDIGTGYFARLTLDTDSLVSVPFVRDITSLIYGYEPTMATAQLHENSPPTQCDATAFQALDDDFWQGSLLDDDAMLHLDDWSTFSRTSPVEMPLGGMF